MKASFSDLWNKPGKIIRALERNEPVTVFYRGRPKAVLHPIGGQSHKCAPKVKDHPAFGLWADRADLADVPAHACRLRRGRPLRS